MTALANHPQLQTLDFAHAFDITGPKARLCAAEGGYEIVHESNRFQICAYALVAPEPDRKRINADDELYIVLEGNGVLRRRGSAARTSGRSPYVCTSRRGPSLQRL